MLDIAKGYKFVAPILLGAAFIALWDWFSISDISLSALDHGTLYFLLPTLLMGNLILPALGANIYLQGVDGLFSLASSRSRIRMVQTAALVAIVASPYAAWLSIFTFSGPQMQTVTVRPILIGLMTVSVSLCFALVTLLSFLFKNKRKLRNIWSIIQLLLSFLSSQINHVVYPNEYEPLHVFVSIWTVLFAVDGARRLIGSSGILKKHLRRITAIACLAALLMVATASIVLTKNQFMAALIWSDTATSRYITKRFTPGEDMFSDSFALKKGGANLLLRPNYDAADIATERAKRAANPKPNIVLFWIDNVQASHVGSYGYRRNPTTPHMDRLAKQGIVFENAYSSFPQTRNFACSLLWGRFVRGFKTHNPQKEDIEYSLLKQLGKAGYYIYVESIFEESKARGFDPETYDIHTYADYRNGHAQEEQVLKSVRTHLIEANRVNKPALIWIHLYRPHWKDRTRFNSSDKYVFGNKISDMYDSAIAHSDWVFSEVQKVITRNSRAREILWVIGSDHGAGIDKFETDIGKSLYNEHVHVPLIVVAKGIKPGRIATPVDISLDIAATLLDFVGVTPPSHYDGISLIPEMLHRDSRDRAIMLYYGTKRMGVVTRQWKLINYAGTVRLFDLNVDPLETNNVADSHPDIVLHLKTLEYTESMRRRSKRPRYR